MFTARMNFTIVDSICLLVTGDVHLSLLTVRLQWFRLGRLPPFVIRIVSIKRKNPHSSLLDLNVVISMG